MENIKNDNVISVKYTDKGSERCTFQNFLLSDEAAEKLYQEICDYEGGQIEIDSAMFNILTACRYLAKLEGFEGMPNFDIDIPEYFKQRERGTN